MTKIRKKNKKDKCKRCGKEFNHYSWDKQKFCSTKCINHKPNFKCSCATCGKDISKYKRDFSRNKFNYCSRECYEMRRTENLARIKRHTKYFLNLVSSGCIDCGEKSYYLLQIHHIDSNKKNNKPNNLEVVCSNCHIKRHLKIDRFGKLSYHPLSLTDRNSLRDL